MGAPGYIGLSCYLLVWLFIPYVHSADDVTQTPEHLPGTEGESVQISCSYTTSRFYSMQWYRHSSNGGTPKYLNEATGSNKYGDHAGKYQPEVDTSSKSGTLRINPTLDDSAIYYCAIELSQ